MDDSQSGTKSFPFSAKRKSGNYSNKNKAKYGGGYSQLASDSSSDSQDNMFSSPREEVGAYASDEGEIMVGEELFTELCDAWLKTHGSRVLKKVLQDWEKIKHKKPKPQIDNP